MSASSRYGAALLFIVAAPHSHANNASWRILVECSEESALGAVLISAHAKVQLVWTGMFAGSISNDVGNSGDFRAIVACDNVAAVVTYPGGTPIFATLTFNHASGQLEGIDSNGNISITASIGFIRQ